MVIYTTVLYTGISYIHTHLVTTDHLMQSDFIMDFSTLLSISIITQCSQKLPWNMFFFSRTDLVLLGICLQDTLKIPSCFYFSTKRLYYILLSVLSVLHRLLALVRSKYGLDKGALSLLCV